RGSAARLRGETRWANLAGNLGKRGVRAPLWRSSQCAPLARADAGMVPAHRHARGAIRYRILLETAFSACGSAVRDRGPSPARTCRESLVARARGWRFEVAPGSPGVTELDGVSARASAAGKARWADQTWAGALAASQQGGTRLPQRPDALAGKQGLERFAGAPANP